jgi:hypothetical protein
MPSQLTLARLEDFLKNRIGLGTLYGNERFITM